MRQQMNSAPPPVATTEERSSAPGGLAVLFCGTLEKRHPFTGATYPRFVVLTASAIHWFRRPEKSELFGEPRGVLSLTTLRKASIIGNDRRELCLEFDPVFSPLGNIYGGNPPHTAQLQRVSSTETIRASSASSARVIGTKRSFICPTTATAIAWRAAIDLAKRAHPSNSSMDASCHQDLPLFTDHDEISPLPPISRPKFVNSSNDSPTEKSGRKNHQSTQYSQRVQDKNASSKKAATGGKILHHSPDLSTTTIETAASAPTVESAYPPKRSRSASALAGLDKAPVLRKTLSSSPDTSKDTNKTGRFSSISAKTANPSSIAEYLTNDVATSMEDGYGDGNFLEALGDIIAQSDEYALPSQSSNSHSAVNRTFSPVVSMEIRRVIRERSELHFIAAVICGNSLVARELALSERVSNSRGSPRCTGKSVSFASTYREFDDDLKSLDEEADENSITNKNCPFSSSTCELRASITDQLRVIMSDGTVACTPVSALLDAAALLDGSTVELELMDPRYGDLQLPKQSTRRLLVVKVHDLCTLDNDIATQDQVVEKGMQRAEMRLWGAAFVLALATRYFNALFVLVTALAGRTRLIDTLIACLLGTTSVLLREDKGLNTKKQLKRKSSIRFVTSTIKLTFLDDVQRAVPIESVSLRDELIDESSDKPEMAKFLALTKGDKNDARRRFALSQAWRRRERVDKVLTEPQPFFDVIKDAYPHWLGGRTKSGELVYWERVGAVDVEKLKKAGVTLEALVRHYIFSNEWTWKVHSTCVEGPESFQAVVLDVAGIRLSQVGGLRLEYLRACADIAQVNYPERTSKYIVINAPAWFAAAWRVVEPMLHTETRSKICICRAGKPTKDALTDIIDPEFVPACYGGQFAPGQSVDDARRNTSEEIAFKKFVDEINKKNLS